MIKVEQLTKRFGRFTAVDGLNLDIVPGEVLGFLGPNGAGKSTSMKMICGFLTPTSGRVTIDEHDMQHDALAAKRLIGYLPEGAPLYGEMTPRQFLYFIASVRGLKGAEQKAGVSRVVDQLQLASVFDKPIEQLSKGFKRRVGLAQAMIHDPKILVLDEPTDGLDPNQKHEVRQLIQNLSKDKIVIISTHILEEVTAVCTRAVIIAQGRLQIDSTPQSLLEMSRYYRAVTLRTAVSDKMLDAIRDLPGVADVRVAEKAVQMTDSDNGASAQDAMRDLTIFPVNSAVIYPAVDKLFHKKSWPLESIHVEPGRLDDVFRRLTQEAV